MLIESYIAVILVTGLIGILLFREYLKNGLLADLLCSLLMMSCVSLASYKIFLELEPSSQALAEVASSSPCIQAKLNDNLDRNVPLTNRSLRNLSDDCEKYAEATNTESRNKAIVERQRAIIGTQAKPNDWKQHHGE